jgi:hypothetical protein
MGRFLTPDRLAQDPDGAIFEDSTRLAALSLTLHVLLALCSRSSRRST